MEHRQKNDWGILSYIIPPIILGLLTTLVYYPSLNYEFQFDDIANITKHFQIRHYAFGDLFFSGTRWISYWLNSLHYKIGKFDPFTYRLGNLIIHTTNGILIFFLLFLALRALKKKSFFTEHSFSFAFLTALLFLLHPVQTQTVSYVIQGQLEGLSALFSLSMIVCFLCINQSSSLITRIMLTILFFTLAVFATGTKEIAIIIPFLVLLIDWFFVAQGSVKQIKSRAWFHLINTVIIVGFYIWYLKASFFAQLFGLQIKVGNNLGNIITTTYNDEIKPLHFFISQFKVILHYLQIFIWPFGISVEYDWVLVQSFLSPDCIFPFLFLVAIAYTLYKIFKKDSTNLIVFGALWFAIALAPRSSILPSPELLVDYKTYLASMGWLFIIAAVIIKLFNLVITQSASIHTFATQYKIQYICVALMALTLGVSTTHRNLVWKSGIDFWGNILENAPGKARVYNNYGVEISQKLGKFAESIPYFKKAIDLDKQYRDPYNNLSVAYAATHQLDLAIDTLKKSLKINPHYAEAYNNIASFLIEKKEFDRAKEALGYALKLRSYYGKAYFNLGRVYMEEGEPEKAHECFKKACLEADLDNEAGFYGYAKSAFLLKKYDETIFACKKLLEFNPNNTEIIFILGNSYYLSDKFNEAIAVYSELTKKTPMNGNLWYNLAETYYSAGDMQKALQCFERVRKMPGATPNAYIRIAACYETLGMPQQSKVMLEELLKQNLPDDARQTVYMALNKLITQYKLA